MAITSECRSYQRWHVIQQSERLGDKDDVTHASCTGIAPDNVHFGRHAAGEQACTSLCEYRARIGPPISKVGLEGQLLRCEAT